MDSSAYSSSYELFLVLEPFRARFSEILADLTPLEGDEAPTVCGTDIYYRVETDVALLALRFDERSLTYTRLAWVLDLAASARVPVLDPARLGNEDRHRFYHAYLDEYRVRAQDQAGCQLALTTLASRIGLTSANAPSTSDPSDPIVVPAKLPKLKARTHPPPLPPHLRGRRLGSSPPVGPAPVALGKESGIHQTLRERGQSSLAEQAAAARAAAIRRAGTVKEELAGSDSGPATEVEEITNVEPAGPLVPLARGKSRSRERKETVPATPIARSAVIDDSVDESAHKQRGETAAHEQREPEPAAARIEVSCLRGGKWATARLRSLSTKGAYVVTSALPQVGDSVFVSLSYGDAAATVQGEVHHVTSVDDATDTGSTGFSLNFNLEPGPARSALIDLLKAARAAGVRIKPPPARQAVRFPVHWPIRMGTPQGGFNSEALDLSVGGMFVAAPAARDQPVEQILVDFPGADGALLHFSIPLDNADASVHGRARIVRRVDKVDAHARGLRDGVGLAIVEISQADERRYGGFLDRVRQRSNHRVLVGASPARIAELTAGLAAVGYDAIGVSDPGMLASQVSDSHHGPPHVAIIDASFHDKMINDKWLEQMLSTRDVPCITTRGETAQRARAVVDRLLEISN